MSVHDLKLCCPPDAVFVAVRSSGVGFVDVEVSDAEGTGKQFLPRRLDLACLARLRFEWLPGDDATRQLALAMLAYTVGRDLALAHFEDFATGFVQDLPLDGWRIPAIAVLNWLRVVLAETHGLESTEGPTNA